MIGAGVFSARPGGAGRGQRPPGRSGTRCRRRLLQGRRRRSSPRSIRSRAARTCTGVSGSANGGGSSPAGASSSARPRRALRWRSHSPRTRWPRSGALVALVAVVALTTVNYRGISRTAGLARVLVAVSVAALLIVSAVRRVARRSRVTGLGRSAACTASYARRRCCSSPSQATRASRRSARRCATRPGRSLVRSRSRWGSRSSTGSSGFGPARTGRAVLGASTAPLARRSTLSMPAGRAARTRRRDGRSLGALLALIRGLAGPARDGAERRSPERARSDASAHRVPHRAELAIALVVSVLVLTTDLRGAIGFSSFGVLLYYAIANASAFTLGQG